MTFELMLEANEWVLWYKTMYSEREFMIKFNDRETAIEFLLRFTKEA